MSIAAAKYNASVPRYTSYPPVPHWDQGSFNAKNAIFSLRKNLKEQGEMALYLHLPFCEALCTYCGCNKRITKNHGVETPYINNILKEWDLYLKELDGIEFTISGIHLGGGTPTFFSAANLKLLIDGITDKVSLSKNAALSFEGHPANTTPEQLQTLYDVGFRRMSLGIQDFDPVVQRAIHRWQSVGQVVNCVNTARDIGYTSINFDLIYGLPFQNLNGLTSTFEEVIKMKPDRIAYYSYAHVPWVSKSQRAYDENDLPTPELKMALYDRGYEMLQEAGYIDIGMDHFTLPEDELFEAREHGHLHRNFMGYTHDREMLQLGLGVSAITDAQGAYWQNDKTVESWAEWIEKDQLPIVKGHMVNITESEIRKRILKLSCYFKLPEKDILEAMTVDPHVRYKLYEFAQDGLIVLNEWGLEVTNKGRNLVRNVCAAFDPNIEAGQEGVFSKAI